MDMFLLLVIRNSTCVIKMYDSIIDLRKYDLIKYSGLRMSDIYRGQNVNKIFRN